MVPPFCNYAIQLLKDTSLVSAVAAPEIMFRARNLVMETYLSMHIYLLAAIIYLAVSIPLSHLASRLQRNLRGAH
jgi:ABC-type amino acid transport system permease subunit